MPTSPLNRVVQHLLADLRPDGDGMTDGELLARFLSSRDDDALAALVRRHAPMVWGVCRRLLHNHHDAEDAFQATFLVLVRKAADVPRQAVANWLYGVARQTAVRLRATVAKRGRRETQVVNMPEPTAAEARDAELQAVVDGEVSRLPHHYRGVIVLCDLEGMTRKEAARQLGIPAGSVASRLARARALLAKRLNRRGVGFSGGSVAAVLSAGSASASAAPDLVASTIKAASLLAAGRAAGVVSARVAALTEGMVKAMFVARIKGVLAVVLVVAALAGAAGLIYQTQAAERPITPAPVPVNHGGGDSPADEGPAATAGGGADAPRERPHVRQPDLTGRVVAVGTDGKSFTVAGVARERPAESVKVEVTIGEKTAVTYDGVTTGWAKPTEGYAVSVWMDDAVKGLAARVGFGGSEGGNRWADLTGTVVEVDPDGKGIAVEVAAEGGTESKKVRVRFNERTVLAFSDVTEARVEKNQTAWVWYDDHARVGGNRIAGQVQFYGGALPARRNRGPDVSGKLLSADDRTLTIEQPVASPGGEPKKVVLKLGAKSSFVYHNVGPGGAKPTEGQQAQVWLEDGSEDTAAEVALSGVVPERWATLSGKVVGVSGDGATVTLEQPPAVRGGKPTRVEVKLTGQTRIAYSNVGPNGATPAAGYLAVVWLLDGSKNTAARATFTRHGDQGQ
jgi:RNA polymerase sigma factor (sigma-70 family)